MERNAPLISHGYHERLCEPVHMGREKLAKVHRIANSMKVGHGCILAHCGFLRRAARGDSDYEHLSHAADSSSSSPMSASGPNTKSVRRRRCATGLLRRDQLRRCPRLQGNWHIHVMRHMAQLASAPAADGGKRGARHIDTGALTRWHDDPITFVEEVLHDPRPASRSSCCLPRSASCIRARTREHRGRSGRADH
jgi:hypothetical protein